MFRVPILLIAFNRPNKTRKAIDVIKKINPKILFVSVDGPRSGNIQDIKKCDLVKKIIDNEKCNLKVKKKYNKSNLGCGSGPVSAINWFFENIDAGIILEDDCIANDYFFNFCEDLLDYYKDNDKIMHIGGNNYNYGKKYGGASYYFSKYSHVWGWATWSRAWKYNNHLCLGRNMARHVWDAQWQQSIKMSSGLSIVPNVNLVSNIGFDDNATHTGKKCKYTNLKTEIMKFPLIHPRTIKRNYIADYRTAKYHFGYSFTDKMRHILNSFNKK